MKGKVGPRKSQVASDCGVKEEFLSYFVWGVMLSHVYRWEWSISTGYVEGAEEKGMAVDLQCLVGQREVTARNQAEELTVEKWGRDSVPIEPGREARCVSAGAKRCVWCIFSVKWRMWQGHQLNVGVRGSLKDWKGGGIIISGIEEGLPW